VLHHDDSFIKIVSRESPIKAMALQRDSGQSRDVGGERNKTATKEEKENEKIDYHHPVVRCCDVGGSGCSEGSGHHCAGGVYHHQEDDEKACEESETCCKAGGCASGNGYPQQVTSSRNRYKGPHSPLRECGPFAFGGGFVVYEYRGSGAIKSPLVFLDRESSFGR
jgi:hypothetical protein